MNVGGPQQADFLRDQGGSSSLAPFAKRSRRDKDLLQRPAIRLESSSVSSREVVP